jgi:hypothetical protein
LPNTPKFLFIVLILSWYSPGPGLVDKVDVGFDPRVNLDFDDPIMGVRS